MQKIHKIQCISLLQISNVGLIVAQKSQYKIFPKKSFDSILILNADVTFKKLEKVHALIFHKF